MDIYSFILVHMDNNHAKHTHTYQPVINIICFGFQFRFFPAMIRTSIRYDTYVRVGGGAFFFSDSNIGNFPELP